MAHPHGSVDPETGAVVESDGHLPPGSLRARGLLFVLLVPAAIATVIGVVLLWPSGHGYPVPPQYQTTAGGTVPYVNGTVTLLRQAPCGSTTPTGPVGGDQTCVVAEVRLAGAAPGQPAAAVEYTPDGDVTVPDLAVGDKVRLARAVDAGSGSTVYYFDDFRRGLPIGALAAGFALLVVLVGRWRGLAALGGVAVTYVVLAKFLLPDLLDGRSPVAVAVVASSALMFLLLYLAHGLSARTSTALLGTLLGLALTTVLGSTVVAAAHITGLSSEENTTLKATEHQISLTGLLLCGLIVGALGVLNDVTVTQASAVWELHEADPDAGSRQLYRSAMRIGRDHIASTVYTLVFAYAGAALPVLLLFTLAQRPAGQVLTGDEVGIEVIRSLVGAVGLVAAVPITTALGAIVVTGSGPGPRRGRPERRHRPDDDFWAD